MKEINPNFSAAQIRPVEINGLIIVGRREQSVETIKNWFERQRDSMTADDVRVVSLLEKYRGRTIAEIVRGFDFDPDELPMFLFEFDKAADEEESPGWRI